MNEILTAILCLFKICSQSLSIVFIMPLYLEIMAILNRLLIHMLKILHIHLYSNYIPYICQRRERIMYEQPQINMRPRLRFPNLKKIIAIIIIVTIVVTVPIAAMRTVPAGYKGVLLYWGEAVNVENEGLNWVVPIAQDIALVNTQIQKAESTETAASSDLQDVTTTIAVNYRVRADSVLTLYKDLRNDYLYSAFIFRNYVCIESFGNSHVKNFTHTFYIPIIYHIYVRGERDYV